jgi:hypothetical protein
VGAPATRDNFASPLEKKTSDDGGSPGLTGTLQGGASRDERP